jgi:multiple sugar transport system ATP-binding protein
MERNLIIYKMASISLANLTKYFGKVRAVEDLNLKAKDGEFLVLLGPSGCGKTTVLRMIAGLEEPTQGEIYIGDRLVNDLPPKDREVAMVFQSYALYPHMLVKDNIAFPLKMRKIKKDEIQEKVYNAAKILNMENLLERKPKELSGGQRQRVALGRAIVRKPKAFLMDEPLSNLDAKLRTYMRGELKKLHEKLGTTIIYVTHDQVEAMTMASRIALLKDGILQQFSAPEKIYNNPTNNFVAGFLGSPSMNFIKGRIEVGSFVCPAFSYPLSKNLPIEGNEVIFGIRPENIKVSKAKESEIEGEVYITEPLGAELIVSIKLKEEFIIAKASPDLGVNVGDTVWLEFDDRKIQIFDCKRGKSLAYLT